MKKVTFCLAFLFLGTLTFAQNKTELTPARKATEKFAVLYNLDPAQQAEMLKIQERKYRNLAEIESLKSSDAILYGKKIRALQYATFKSFERVLRKDQMQIHRQQQTALRDKKAKTYKELKSGGASDAEINNQMLAIDLESLE